MKYLRTAITALLLFIVASAALAQNAGTGANHAFMIGKGPTVQGYTSLLCGSGQLAIGSATDPTCRTLSGDAAVDATGVVTLATVNANVGTFGSSSQCVTFTADGKGRITAASQTACAPTGITQLTGDVAAGPGSGAQAATLASIITAGGPIGSATVAPIITWDAKGRVTVVSSATIAPAIGSITGLGAGCATFLGTPSSANLRGCLNDETGTGLAYFQGGALGTPASGDGSNLINLNATQLTSGIIPNARLNATITPQGRLTLTSGTPVLTGNVTGATSVIYALNGGNLVPIYDGTNMIPTAVPELSNVNANSSTGSAGPAVVANNSCYDYFVWSNAGTPTLTRGPLWTSTLIRSAGTVLTRVNGVLLNSVSITNGPAASRGTYVGTGCSNGTATFDWFIGGAASGGSAGFFSLWNYYNRVLTTAFVVDNGATYTYSIGSARQARASAGNQVSFVLGLQEDGIAVSYAARSQTSGGILAAGGTGIGLDLTSSYSCSSGIFQAPVAVAVPVGNTNSCNLQVGIGLHFIAALENSDGSNANTYDAASNNTLSTGVRN